MILLLGHDHIQSDNGCRLLRRDIVYQYDVRETVLLHAHLEQISNPLDAQH